MDYKYHHKALEILFKRKRESTLTDSNNESSNESSSTPKKNAFSASAFSKELKIKDVDKVLSILSNLRADDCLHSGYNPAISETEFWISDKGASKYFERFYYFKFQEQKKDNCKQIFMILFYFISTVGIIFSICNNTNDSKETKNRLEKIEKQVFQDSINMAP